MREQANPMLPPRPIEGTDFREAMSSVVAPVTIVTARDGRGEPIGFTASAVVSLSLDPPLLLVCVDRRSSSHDPLVAATQFCVNVLGADGKELARRFGSHRRDKFDGVATDDLLTGTPSLPIAMSRILCAVHGLRDGGDHTIVLGRVLSFRRRPDEPLAWWGRHFQRLARVN